MKKKVFKVGDRVRLDPRVYKGDAYCVEYVMTVVEVDSTSITVDGGKFADGSGFMRRVNGSVSYFRRADYTDEITGRRYNECE